VRFVFNNSKFTVSFCILLGGAAALCRAQAPDTIGLRQAVDSALSNYPELRAKQSEIRSANAAVDDADHQILPSLKISDQVDAGTDNSLDGSYFPLGVVPSTSGGIGAENNSNLFSGNIAVAYLEGELYNFGLNGARIATAKSLVKSSRADYAATAYSLQLQIAQLYFELLKYRLLTGIQQKNIDRYNVLYSYTKAYTGSGLRAGVDSSIANAEISKAKIQYIQTLQIYSKLKSEFAYYTGIHGGDFEIDTGLYHLPDSLLARLETGVFADSVGGANPLLAYYQSRWEYAVSQENLIRKSYLPKIDVVGAGWMRGSSISPQDAYGDLASGLNYSRYDYMAGLAFTYDIFDLVHQKDRSAVQAYQAEAAYDETQGQKTFLENQLRQADIDIQSTLEKEKEIPVQLQAAQDAYSQKSAQYNAGMANIAELTDASYLLYQAETDAVETRTDLLKTLLQKAYADNTLDSFLKEF